ncbi:E3 ubiquitin-protein ligase RBBP6 [Gossypium arboreum]|uniref:E3 ubiquitin-protein ligase RBBP6 n=1 Tax=Gossypium arboreum TaxID=29729 RepID=A0A0B0NVA1_GOSAR|nr:E3 ubiquitin-protein ligase RBBP6 [Gossypium arboreum]
MSESWKEARAIFFDMMDEWFREYLRNRPEIPRPPPPTNRPDEILHTTGGRRYPQWYQIKTLHTWDFFQVEFEKKYISQRFLVSKRKEFLELKQGNKTVSEYEREFVRLSQYATEWVQSEAEIWKRFEEGINEEIKLLIGILKIQEFTALVDRAKKAEELKNEKKQAKREAQVSSKRSSGRAHSFPTKKLRSHQERSTLLVGYSDRARSSKRHNSKSSSPVVTSVGSVNDQKPKCKSYNKFHFREFRMKSGACFRCGSPEHFLRGCPERANKEDAIVKSNARALARTYAIRAREGVSAPDVITRDLAWTSNPTVRCKVCGSAYLR